MYLAGSLYRIIEKQGYPIESAQFLSSPKDGAFLGNVVKASYNVKREGWADTEDIMKNL
ncbi:MAG: hypothetical protein WA137_10140 [Methanothrix sp.]